MSDEPQPKFPNGYHEVYKQIRGAAPLIMMGTMVCIDPSSGGTSMPGFAIYKAGELLTSGTIAIPRKKPIYERLQVLHEKVSTLVPDPPDVFVIEQIRGGQFSHVYLTWAVGVSIAAARTPLIIELPINIWKSVAKVTEGYLKNDAMDAEILGKSLVLLAQRELNKRDKAV